MRYECNRDTCAEECINPMGHDALRYADLLGGLPEYPPPEPPDHVCGPESQCDSLCAEWAAYIEQGHDICTRPTALFIDGQWRTVRYARSGEEL